MKYKYPTIIIYFLLIVLMSCSNSKKVDVKTLVESLETLEEQKQFLEDIIDLDQQVRKDESEVVRTFGISSPEYKATWEVINKTDALNLEKIEAFFDEFGHPTIEKHGEKAARTPYMVIHHASDYGPREQNFSYLYRALKKGDLSGSSLAFFLGRMHDLKFGNLLSWDRPFKEEEEIDSLINLLELEKIAFQVDLEMNL